MVNDKHAEAIALLRHEIISPVLMEQSSSQMSYFKKIAEKDFMVPGVGVKRFKPNTMKHWLNQYQKHGFSGILPKRRRDFGKSRKLTDSQLETIIERRKEDCDVSVVQFYKKSLRDNLLGDPPISMPTLRLHLQKNNLTKKQNRTARKRYEMSRFGELWVADFSHTINVLHGKRTQKAIIFAIIDDYSRVIVGSRFFIQETTIPIEIVFKEAILAHGLPDRFYCDNGPSFSSGYLRKVCARLGIGLIHSKPYDSPSRGKIERYFRTMKDSFISSINETLTLEKLNESYEIWLRKNYHHVNHRGIDERPIDRYQRSVSAFPLNRENPDTIDELFMVEVTRKVLKDATISYQSNIFEVPAKYIGKKIVLRHKQDDSKTLYIYEDNKRKCAIKHVDTRLNGRIYRPKREDHISLTRREDI